MEALGINLGLVIVQIIAFFIVFLTLNAWVYKPMLNMLEARGRRLPRALRTPVLRLKPARTHKRTPIRSLRKPSWKPAGSWPKPQNAPWQLRTTSRPRRRRILPAAHKAAAAEAELERSRILGDLRGQVAALAIAASEQTCR